MTPPLSPIPELDTPGLASVFAHAPVGICLLNHQLRYLDINEKLAQINGLSTEAHLGRSPEEILPPELAAQVMALLQRALEKQENVSAELVLQNGLLEQRWIAWYFPVRDAEGMTWGVGCVVVEKPQEPSSEFYDAMLASLRDSVLVVNADGMLQLANDAARRLWGDIEKETLSPECVEKFGLYLPDGRTPFPYPQLPLLRALNGEAVYDEPLMVRNSQHPEGRLILVTGLPLRQTGGVLAGAVVVCRDITEKTFLREEQQRLAAELQRSAIHLRLAADAARIGTFDWYPATGQLVWDRQCKLLFGLKPEEEVNIAVFFALLHPEERDRLQKIIEVALTPESQGEYSAEYRIIHPESGQVRWIGARGKVSFDAQGEPERMIGTTQDITQVKEAQRLLTERVERQSQITEAVQRSLLLAPAPDAYPGVVVGSLYRSAESDALIGGDFFDIFPLTADTLALVVGDSTGKGLAAATYTAEIKFALRAFLREHGSLSRAVSLLNSFIVRNNQLDDAHRQGAYIALSAVLLNTRTGAFTCVNAGAEPPLLVGGEEQTAAGKTAGPLLGIADGMVYRDHEGHLPPEQALLLLTDGLTETRQGRNLFFGREGVARAAETAVSEGKSPEQIAETVAATAHAWGGSRQMDDICLLVAQRQPWKE